MIREPDPAVRARRARADPATCARPRGALSQRDAAADRPRPRAQPARQHGRLQPATAPRRPAPPAATRATSTGSPGSPTTATASSRRRTPTASTAASTSPRAARRGSPSSPRPRSRRSASRWSPCSVRDRAAHDHGSTRRLLMQKQAPSVGRILVAVGFALSCFGLLLFLWVTFGGPIPFKPESYRFTADFPEAITARRRRPTCGSAASRSARSRRSSWPRPTSGWTATTHRGDDRDRPAVRADLLRRAGDPAPEDAARRDLRRADHRRPAGQQRDPRLAGRRRQRLRRRDPGRPVDPRGRHLGIGQTQNATQIDEIFNALDEQTRKAFQRWMQNSAIADQRPRPRPQRRLRQPRAVHHGRRPTCSRILRRQKTTLQGLVRDTGTVFDALTARDQELAGAITGSNQTFGALASRDQALAETFRIFPDLQRESRLTLDRLDQFAGQHRAAGPRPEAGGRRHLPDPRVVRRLSPEPAATCSTTSTR